MKRLLNKRGFTLIELMVVMAIIAVLAVLIVGAIQVARRTSIETTNRANAKTIQIAMEGYYAKSRAYPVLSNQSFTTVDGGADIGADVTLTASCTGSIGAQPANGGGYINSTATGYTIYVANYSCTSELTGDKLTVQ